MKILVVGSPSQQEAFKAKFQAKHNYEFAPQLNQDPSGFDVVFDFTVADQPEQMEMYADVEGLILFINAPKIALGELAYYQAALECKLFGFNGLPTFIERDILEVSCLNIEDAAALKGVCEALDTDFELVQDRVGMVTPRIIFMIINEAYYTLQEGTATKADIDQGMKLGTNYPHGPFEWCELIGLDHVYETLEALYEDTKEERYKICPLLKQAYLRTA